MNLTAKDVLPAQERIPRSAFAAGQPGERSYKSEAALRKRIEGEVRFDPGSRALYATDLSIYRQPPIGVVIPRSIEDVLIAVEEWRHGAPILGRGCGTSLAGQTCNVAVVIDFSKYLNRLIAIDDVSVKVGEHALLPRVRGESADTLIIADGFSCREQIAQTANRRAMHLSEILAMALPNAKPATSAPRHGWGKEAAAAAAIGVVAGLAIGRP